MLIKVTHNPIDRDEALRAVADPSCGAVTSFEGNIRNHNEGKEVLGLEYEVYEGFLKAEVERIFREAGEQWPVAKVALIQRVGRLDVGETGIIIAVSSPHRKAALSACSYIIEEFKKRAPVWKKEHYPDGSDWVYCAHHSQ
ncbi:MAG: molybdenum cofactor biosynthesis protein MoaE [bacterium]|nr:molybdenum cofactor biosynthesis protein MoaE [bacterium]